MQNRKVLLGMSGGTDSSVAVLLLQDAGYEVVGITFRFWENGTQYLDEVVDLAHKMNIKHIIYDARELFKSKIIDYFVNEYMSGKTPVPCVLCNNFLKWKLLADEAERLEIDNIATGHYAQIKKIKDIYYIKSGVDPDKDQSFFLWGLEQNILNKMILPLGKYYKKEIRKIAENRGYLKIATKKDSMGVCFCPGDYRKFILDYVTDPNVINPGNFVDENGKFLGRHKGYPFFTVGQRRGLNLQSSKPLYVDEIKPEQNIVVITEKEKTYNKIMYIEKWVLINPELVIEKSNVIVKIRYKKQFNYGIVTYFRDMLRIVFDKPVDAIAKGQSACFYINDIVVGGGIIHSRE